MSGASASDHIALANRNQEALAYLLREYQRFPEWIACVSFYKALHVVDAMLDVQGADLPTDHRSRARIMKSERRFDFIYGHYRLLWNAASIARYLSDEDGGDYKSFADYMSPEKVVSELVRHRLNEVEIGCVLLLKEHAKRLVLANPAAPAAAGGALPAAPRKS